MQTYYIPIKAEIISKEENTSDDEVFIFNEVFYSKNKFDEMKRNFKLKYKGRKVNFCFKDIKLC